MAKEDDLFYLDFPVDTLTPIASKETIELGIGIVPKKLYLGKTDYLAILNTEDDVKNIQPDFNIISKLNARGLIVSATGNTVDFVSRFFAPQSGINEDPVTGSAHTTLVPYWAKELNKITLTAKQISPRSGLLFCKDQNDRIIIGGKAQLYLAGEIYIDELN